jgi:hypothetical protein
MSCDVCRKAGLDIAGKTKFVTGKEQLKRKSNFIFFLTVFQKADVLNLKMVCWS